MTFSFIEDLSFSQADQFLLDHLPLEQFTPGFERVKKVFSPLLKRRAEFPRLKISTIAGTNGKGEVAMGLAHLSHKKQRPFFLWTSPHITSVRERFVSHNGYISEQDLLLLFKKHSGLIGELSFYEFLYYCFMDWVFSHEDLNESLLILEVGLGGRLDTTNLFDCDCSAIVSIGRDHQKILGNSLKEILREKFGITRSKVPLFSGVGQDFLKRELESLCQEKAVPLYEVKGENYIQINRQITLSIWNTLYPDQKSEASLLDSLKLRGRREVREFYDHQYVFNGSHNRDGLKSLFNLYQNSNTIELQGLDYLLSSFSHREEDEIREMLKMIKANKCIAKTIIFCPFEHPRALDPKLLQELVEFEFRDEILQGRVLFQSSIERAISILSPSSKSLVLGSYFFIGEFKAHLS